MSVKTVTRRIMNTDKNFYIVALGASAGGLNALEQFFAAMPSDSGMAFVVIQHLSPDFKSLMDDLLARHTDMAILQAIEGIELEPNTIYLAPPRFQMGLIDGRIILRDKPVGLPAELAIDTFFRSLAEDCDKRSIGIVLSGTGSDGSRGIQAIREAGGLVIVQTPDSAQFDGMPRNAIATGNFDFKLSPELIPKAIVEYAKDPEGVRSRLSHTLESFPEDGEYAGIFALLRRSFNVDFSKYRTGMVGRRIVRRLELKGISSFDDYVPILTSDSDELDALYHDLLIGVTEFFRDPETFDYLAKIVIPEIIASSRGAEELRVWSACCATGEEAYSLAIILTEVAEACYYRGKITIFATDVHKRSLEAASIGVYNRDRLTNVSPERLSRFFRQDQGESWRIIPDIRKLVIFAPHNVICDPPFTKTDLVCCRNMLIYLQPDAQERVITTFHYALKVSGILLLGSSEGLGPLTSEFETLEAHYKIFRKKRELRLPLDFKTTTTPTTFNVTTKPAQAHSRMINLDRQLLLDYDLLLDSYIPSGILVDENHTILHSFGRMQPYLFPMPGRTDTHMLSQLAHELHVAVSTTLQRAARDKTTAMLSGVQLLQENGPVLKVEVSVKPLYDHRTKIAHFFISFRSEEYQPIALLKPEQDEEIHSFEERLLFHQHITDLEQDLQLTKENLQAANEELQASNEELQATNEELLASNEELQSTNEELHSVNEELFTVNSEFESKNSELSALNLDLENLLTSIDIGTVFIDKMLCIRKFNSAITGYFNLLSHDIGRPIDHISYRLSHHARLMEGILKVLASGELIEEEDSDPWYRRHILIRILPFKTSSGNVDGVVILFTDVSRVKEAELKVLQLNEELEQTVQERTKDLRYTEEKLRILLDSTFEAIYGTDLEGNCTFCNSSCLNLLGYASPDDLVGKNLHELIHHKPKGDSLLHDSEWPLFRTMITGEGFHSLNEVMWRSDGSSFPAEYWSYPQCSNEQIIGSVVTFIDITERMRTEEKILKLSSAVENSPATVVITDRNGEIEYVNQKFTDITGYSQQEIIGKNPKMLSAGVHPQKMYQDLWKTISEGNDWRGEFCNKKKNGEIFWEQSSISPLKDSNGNIVSFVAVKEDITQQKHIFEELQQAKSAAETANVAKSSFLSNMSHELRTPMNGVIGMAKLLQMTELDDEQKSYVESLDISSHNLLSLINNVLDLSKIEAGMVAIEINDFSLKKLIDDVVLMQKVAIEKKGLDLTVNISRDIPAGIVGDELRVKQIISNLLSNATKFTFTGGIEIRAHILEHSGERLLIQIAVTDTGVGVPPEITEAIFNPFVQAEDSTTRRFGGTGLGLSICRQLASLMEGRVVVESSQGVGSCFKLIVPFTVSQKYRSLPDSDYWSHMDFTLPRLKILIVEDNEINTNYDRALCRKLGLEAVFAANGKECLAELERQSFDLVLMDIQMPVMNGEEALKAIRINELGTSRHLPVIALTAYSMRLDKDRFLQEGFDGHVSKPVELEYLVYEIKKVLSL